MDLTNSQRILKLATTLIRHPRHVARYCRFHHFLGKVPLEVGLPWWSFSAIEEVRRFCQGAEEVFEFGSGGSTVFLASHCRSVTAVEDDAGWYARMQRHLDAHSIGNVELLLNPFDFVNPVAFEKSEYLHALADRSYDVIVVDGQDWTTRERPVCFARAEEHIRPGGLIIVDDSWRYGHLRGTHGAKAVKVCEGVGPCRVGVTSTDLYFY